MVAFISSFLPVSSIVIETSAFDIQKIKNPDIEGKSYQEGEQLGFWNTREYVLYRDGHKCRVCGGKSKDKVLEIHHVIRRSDGGTDRPDNLITLCSHCHDGVHKGIVKPIFKKAPQFKAETLMSVMRWELYSRLQKLYGKENVSMTYGYLTKSTRITHKLEKSHHIDARCIAGHPEASSDGDWYYMRKTRSHNRKIHKDTILKGGERKLNQTEKLIGGFGLFDIVRYSDAAGYIHGRRSSGYFDIREPNGTKIHSSIHYRNLTLVERVNTRLIEKRNRLKIDEKTF